MTATNGTALHDELQRTTAQWPAASTAKVGTWARGQLLKAAQVNSRRLIAEAKAELANRAMWRFIELCYDGAPGHWYNVERTGRIVIPCPWSRTHHASYGLTDVAGRLLRWHIVGVQDALPERRRLFWFDGQFWHLNRGNFPDLATAQDWLRTVGMVTAARWDALSQAHPNGR